MEKLFGRPPYWFEERIAPRESEFARHFTDSAGRVYMDLWEGALGVLLPRSLQGKYVEVQLPIENDRLLLTKPGTGHQRSIEIVTVQQSASRVVTAWVEYRGI